ncbi:MAG: hypothetical protein LBF12_06840 [Christensenellaceae bacterium]|jgi:hypothetical protein|nr:hypothetical protein [Christensenellaceae bacterium]
MRTSNMSQLRNDFLEFAKLNLDETLNDFNNVRENLRKINPYPQRGQLQFLVVPKIFPSDALSVLQHAAHIITGIFNKVIDRYLEDPSYRKHFKFPKILEKLILTDPGYEQKVPIARVDLFFNEDDYTYKFCEFNTDGASAMNEDKTLVESWISTSLWKKFATDKTLRSCELFNTWVNEFLTIFYNFKLRKITQKNSSYFVEISPGNFAIVDFEGKGTMPEFVAFLKKFRDGPTGKCDIIDIENFKFDGKHLRAPDDTIIDAIYRRAVTSDCIENIDKIKNFIDAVLAQKVCLIGSFRTQIVHNKNIFRILHLKETQSFLNEEEVEFVKDHIPKTFEFDYGKFDYQDVFKNKDKWIIKPADKYGSFDVVCGAALTQSEWESAFFKRMDKGYLVQEYCTPYKAENFYFDSNNQPVFENYNNLTGLFLYNGKLAGLYSRQMTAPATTKQEEGRVAPSLVALDYGDLFPDELYRYPCYNKI